MRSGLLMGGGNCAFQQAGWDEEQVVCTKLGKQTGTRLNLGRDKQNGDGRLGNAATGGGSYKWSNVISRERLQSRQWKLLIARSRCHKWLRICGWVKKPHCASLAKCQAHTTTKPCDCEELLCPTATPCRIAVLTDENPTFDKLQPTSKV